MSPCSPRNPNHSHGTANTRLDIYLDQGNLAHQSPTNCPHVTNRILGAGLVLLVQVSEGGSEQYSKAMKLAGGGTGADT